MDSAKAMAASTEDVAQLRAEYRAAYEQLRGARKALDDADTSSLSSLLSDVGSALFEDQSLPDFERAVDTLRSWGTAFLAKYNEHTYELEEKMLRLRRAIVSTVSRDTRALLHFLWTKYGTSLDVPFDACTRYHWFLRNGERAALPSVLHDVTCHVVRLEKTDFGQPPPFDLDCVYVLCVHAYSAATGSEKSQYWGATFEEASAAAFNCPLHIGA